MQRNNDDRNDDSQNFLMNVWLSEGGLQNNLLHHGAIRTLDEVVSRVDCRPFSQSRRLSQSFMMLWRNLDV